MSAYKDAVEIVPDRWDHDYQPRMKGADADACVVCHEPHIAYIIHLGDRS